MQIRPRFWFALIYVSLFMLSCSSKKDRSLENDPLETSYRLIDQGKYDEAVKMLQQLFLVDRRTQVREGLASAYAARAGIRIKDKISTIAAFTSRNAQVFPKNEPVAVSPLGRMLANLRESPEMARRPELSAFAEALGNIDSWMRRLDGLPTANQSTIADIQSSVSILTDIASPGGHLYRAVLGLILFKYNFDFGFERWDQLEYLLKQIDFKNLLTENNLKLLCSPDFKTFAGWFFERTIELQSITKDLMVPFPSKQAELNSTISEIIGFSSQLSTFMGMACR